MHFIHEPLAQILRATTIPHNDYNKLIDWLLSGTHTDLNTKPEVVSIFMMLLNWEMTQGYMNYLKLRLSKPILAEL